MKLAVMQPYFFPYLGYFQLIRAVDEFVVLDDVNFIKRGWLNRNFILYQENPFRLTLQLKGASQNKRINEIRVGDDKGKMLKTILHCYHKAPYFGTVYPLIEEILSFPDENLARFVENSMRRICEFLGVCPIWHRSSAIDKDDSLRGQDRILAICMNLGADDYINSFGGVKLYSADEFARRGLSLSFIIPKPIRYPQFNGGFVANLSIIDVLMFNGRAGSAALLDDFNLVRGDSPFVDPSQSIDTSRTELYPPLR